MTYNPKLIPMENSNITSFVSPFTFYFTSLNHKQKFDSTYLDKISYNNHIWETRYRVESDTRIISLLEHYSKVENRGFRIEIGGKEYNSPKELKIKAVLNTA